VRKAAAKICIAGRKFEFAAHRRVRFRKIEKFHWKIAMFSQESGTSAENEAVGRKIKTSAECLELPLNIQKFS
jgi:hypothetical protein